MFIQTTTPAPAGAAGLGQGANYDEDTMIQMPNIAIGYRENLPIHHAASLLEEEVPLPRLQPHDLLVQTRAVSVNPVDVKQRAAAPAAGLRILGYDAAGVVREVGSEVTLFSPGDEVFYAGSIGRQGSNQRLHAVDERIVGPKPRTLSFAEAAALPLVSITAWEALFDRLALTPDSEGVLLVIGATGGVGSVLLQLAEVCLPKVTVVATASDAARGDWVRDLGAEHVVNHREDLAAQLAAIAPEGVDWIFTAHSEQQIPVYAEVIRPFGSIVAIDDGPRDIAPLKFKSVSWHWERMFTRPLLNTPDLIEQHRLLRHVADLVDEGRLRHTVSRSLAPIGVENLREAHRLVEEGRVVGKIVLEGWEDRA